MQGFGAPDNPFGQMELGFGDPDNAAVPSPDPGFGDPDGAAPVVFVFSERARPDDGGEIVKLAGYFASHTLWRARLRANPGGQHHPADAPGATAPVSPTPTLALSPRADPTLLTPLFGQLHFILPPAPPGTYDVELSFGPGFLLSIDAATPIEILRRGRSRQQWRLRGTFPEPFEPGARTPWQEDLLPDDDTEQPSTRNLLDAFVRAFAQALAQLAAEPTTLTRATFEPGDDALAVETTLGFPTSGAVWVAGRRMTYTSTTLSSFEGIVEDFPQPEPIEPKAPVVCDVDAFEQP